MYAETRRFRGGPTEQQRGWTPTNRNETLVFIGALIYIGVHKEPQTHYYWRQNIAQGPVHTIPLYMGLVRFEQIKRYLHISQTETVQCYPPNIYDREPTADDEWTYDIEHLGNIWWYKLNPTLNQFRSASGQYYWPSSKISIDETMIKCFGRSRHTFKMPNKPIPQGYKLFAVADQGYIWAFTPASRSQSLVEIVMHKVLTMTGSMVTQLLARLPNMQNHFHIYLDNYFTSIGLFKILRNQGVGACGTTRARGKDFPTLIKIIKDREIKTPWNTLCAIPIQGVLCFSWQDNSIVTGLSTVHTVDKTTDLVNRERRRPASTSTSALITHPIFDGLPSQSTTNSCCH